MRKRLGTKLYVVSASDDTLIGTKIWNSILKKTNRKKFIIIRIKVGPTLY